MNQPTGAEAIVHLWKALGVEHVFGLCGDTSLPLYDALFRTGADLNHVLTRDERSAAYMADAYARLSGKVGVCEGPSGGGATYILPGVVEANESSVPVLAVTTDIATTSRGRFALTELDQAALFRPLTKWNTVVESGAEVPGAFRDAFSAMTTGRPGAAHIGLPFDVQNQPVDEDDVWADAAFGRAPAHPQVPPPAEVEAAAKVLVVAKRPLFICAGGVVSAGAEAALQAVAERLGAIVATSVSGQGAIAETHPLALGVVGSNGGTTETRDVVEAADTVIFVACRAGSVTTERWRFPAPGAVAVIHMDVDAAVIGVNYAADANVVGDARLALEGLLEALGPGQPEAVADWGAPVVAAAKKKKFAAFRALACSDETPIRPERLVAALQETLPDDAVVIADAGTPCPYISAFYEQRRPGRHFISNRAHGALGYGLPAALGAHFARPESAVVAVMGDGGFGFASGELETVVRLGLPLVFVVVSNATFGWIKAGQKSGYDERYYSVDFGRTDHVRIAEAYGVRAWRVEAPTDLVPALAAALADGGPALVDVVSQPLHEARAPVSEWVA